MKPEYTLIITSFSARKNMIDTLLQSGYIISVNKEHIYIYGREEERNSSTKADQDGENVASPFAFNEAMKDFKKKWQNKEWPVHNDAFLWGPSTSGTLYVSEELADKLKKSIHDILNRENE